MYEKVYETKIIRTRHKVTFKEDSPIEFLLSDFEKVPKKSKVVSVDLDCGSVVVELIEEHESTSVEET